MAQVRYIVRDVEQAMSFYLDHLGFRLVQQFGPAMAITAVPVAAAASLGYLSFA